MSRPRPPSVSDELEEEFSQLYREVASWVAATLPCLRCGHLPGEHDPGVGRCWGRQWDPTAGDRCWCTEHVTRSALAADSSGVTPTDQPGDTPA